MKLNNKKVKELMLNVLEENEKIVDIHIFKDKEMCNIITITENHLALKYCIDCDNIENKIYIHMVVLDYNTNDLFNEPLYVQDIKEC